MAEVVAAGIWCTKCQIFEKDIEKSPCESCGCPSNVHEPAAVVVEDRRGN